MAASGTSEDFRTMIARMERDGHLRRIKKPIRPEYITALCGQAPAALMCDAVEGYDIPVVGGSCMLAQSRPSRRRSAFSKPC